jgi:site-specific DNA recombinase
MTPIRRCAIYTRKSSEEGLDQTFNSLDAQREACAAYVLSQAGEGWTTIDTAYDDGGYSGGNMDRPAMQALLTEIRRGQVEVVVVYKVDRLSRSLADFARMVELFDQHNVSFVSVTQAFNTTTSMGRLTLNVLLSFAQFEREVTGERIRDKIAASKAKGLWMGGRPPLGYDGVDSKLVINSAEATTVRAIFNRYLELGSVSKLAAELDRDDIRSKVWTNKRGGQAGGNRWYRGALYHLLGNPTYRGAIRHKEKLYPDSHPAIIDETTWVAVQAKLERTGAGRKTTTRTAQAPLLRGVLHDDAGGVMHAVHTKRGEKRYRYYASKSGPSADRPSVTRIAMGVIDDFIIHHAGGLVSNGWEASATQLERVRSALLSVTLGEDRVEIVIRRQALLAQAQAPAWQIDWADDHATLAVPIRLKHRQGATLIISDDQKAGPPRMDRALVRAVALAWRWADRLARGERGSLKELAVSEGYCEHYAAKLMPLAWLAPDLVEAILDGRQPRTLSLGALMRRTMPVEWGEQRSLLLTIG